MRKAADTSPTDWVIVKTYRLPGVLGLPGQMRRLEVAGGPGHFVMKTESGALGQKRVERQTVRSQESDKKQKERT